MRDLLVFLIVFAILPFVLTRPHLGIYLWTWVGYMNPHRLGWGFAYTFPFSLCIALVTITALLFSKRKLNFFWSPTIGWLLLLNFWMFLTTLFATNPEGAWPMFDKVIKIQLMLFVTLLLIGDKDKINSLIWVIVISIGFFGIKGGFFTLATGGNYHVLGPKGSFIGENNELGMALVMILPFVWYLYLNTKNTLMGYILLISMFLISAGILGTQSRGAFLAISSIVLFLWLNSSKKALLLFVILAAVPFLYTFMPQSWHDRMHTITEYEQDQSVNSRFLAAEMGINLALDRPILGGGFHSHTYENYARYAPHQIESGVATFNDIHNIHIKMLTEHGFVGLFIFIILQIQYWRTANKIIKLSKTSIEHKWSADFAKMSKVSLIGYLTAGLFQGLLYFELFYNILIILIIILWLLETKSEKS